MSDGDEEPEESADAPAPDVDVETLRERLDAAADALENAETEADLDDVEAILDGVESDLEETTLPEPEDDDEEDPADELDSRLSELRDELEAQRGPYAEDVVADVEDAQSTLESTRWTEQGEGELRTAVEDYLDDAGEVLDETFAGADSTDPEALAADLEQVVTAVEAADLDPDEDAATIEALAEVTADFLAAVEDAQEWDDLSVRQKLRAEGYYDAINQKHKDYPPEWTALKQWEQRENVDMILLCLEHLADSEFMERHCMESLKRVGSAEALDEVGQRAARRDLLAVEVVGRIGSEDGIEHVVDFVDAEGNPELRKTALKSLGEIGSSEATQEVANQLVADDDSVRSRAARSLGLIGDTRAIAPLVDVLADDDADTVRASAAWALVQIGTERALEAAAEYADDHSYVVEREAQRAADALDSDAAEATA